MDDLRVIISGGGTGGHIFPAISIANAVKEAHPDAAILFVGAKGRMEMERVPQAGYDIEGLPVRGFFRPLYTYKNIGVLTDYMKSRLRVRKIIRDFRPSVAVGVGGYASGATIDAAHSLGVPILIQEQNSYAGLTNRHLAGKAKRICVAYPNMERFFPANKIVETGNPVRTSLLQTALTREGAVRSFGLDPTRKTILVIGGSLGARTINESILGSLDQIRSSNAQFILQTGSAYIKSVSAKLSEVERLPNLVVMEFISDMGAAYRAADLVISRAGAGTISELSLLGKPCILVPSPNVAEDHQTQNALALSTRNAAILISDADARSRLVGRSLESVSDDSLLISLSAGIRKMALPDAASMILKQIEEISKPYKS